ncbi:hypothetical protein DSECCO2_94310 [anaerobic digester metagenome]
MKYFIFPIFILFFSNVFSQEQQFTSVIPRKYSAAEKFSLLNNANDTIISFTRNGRINSIKKNENNYILKKRKILFDSNSDTVAIYKGKKIFFPSQNIVVTEKKSRNGWAYYLDNNKILEINYRYNKNEENYHITANSKKLDELTANLLQLSLGRFDKRVVMEYDDNDDISTMLIIALVVALS